MPRPALTEPPPCPKGHAAQDGFVVRRAGTYGKTRRQLYACVGPDGARHRFTPSLPREGGSDDVCDYCDSKLAPHTGPVVGRNYLYRLRLVAETLARVGSGWSYVRASNRARVAAGRDPALGSGGGHLAAEWTDAWGPVVIQALAETDPVETLVLDSTDFWWTNARTRARRREFALLVAYGYPAPNAANPKPRVWGVHASPTARVDDWIDLLNSTNLPGPPKSVVTDINMAVPAAVRRKWPTNVPFVAYCEHHLRINAVAALAADQVDHYGSRHMTALNEAFASPAGWEAFTGGLRPKQPATRAWVASMGPAIVAQVQARANLPDHHTTAGAEAAAADLRAMFEQRSFSLRNKDRTNRLLGLARLHLAGQDDPSGYHRVLRDHATNQAGHGPSQRQNRDTRGAPTLRQALQQ